MMVRSTKRRLRPASGLLGAGLLAIGACTVITGDGLGAGLGAECESTDDCQGTSECVDGICTLECGTNADCPEGTSCLAGVCGNAVAVIGDACTTNTDCQSGTCSDGICTQPCATNADCPAPSECLGGACQLPLDVGFIWVGVVEDAGWTRTHDDGRLFAKQQLPYLRDDFVTNIFLPDTFASAVETFKAAGKEVIVANSFSLRNPALDAAESNPDIDFLVCSGNVVRPNLGSYFARSYQAWYLAGFAAASKTKTERLGFVGSFVTPEVVRHIDAFTLGARRANPDIVVEVRWEGFWFDLDPPVNGKTRDSILTEQLIATGCDVIAHNMDTPFVVETVEAYQDENPDAEVYSIGNDNFDACTFGPTTCIGTPSWNWGPMYVRLFEDIHKHRWDPNVVIDDNIRVNPAESVTNFTVNEAVVSSQLRIDLGELLGQLAADPEFAFRGPYQQTGQREAGDIAAGATISDDELATMCWFVEGVVEKTDPDDPTSDDKPGEVPTGQTEIPPGSGVRPDCRVNQ